MVDDARLSPPSARLQADDLACRRGHRTLFEGLRLDLAEGEWVHVRGDNGAGKTSLLRLLAGLARPAAGRVLWDGTDIVRDGADYRAALLYVGHLPGTKDELTALENVRLAAALDGHAVSEALALDALGRLGLRGREDLPLRDLSQGQRRRVALSRLIWRKARLWILDEPLTALDTAAVALVSGLVQAHVDAGGLAVLTSHQNIPMPGGRELILRGGKP